MVTMSSSCFNYMNQSEGNLLQMDEPTYQCLHPSSEMLVANKKVFWFIVGPIAIIRAIRNTALPVRGDTGYPRVFFWVPAPIPANTIPLWKRVRFFHGNARVYI